MRATRMIGLETAAALAAAVLIAAPGHAQHYVGTDPAGDMVKDSTHGVVVAPHHHNLDIRRVVVRHRPHRITIRMKYKALHWPKHGAIVAMGFIRTNAAAMPFPGTRGGPYQWEVDFTRHWRHRP